MPTTPWPRKWLILLVLLLAAAGIAVYFVWFRGRGGRLDAAQLIALKDRAVGLAENAEYDEADKLFEQLAEQLPSEPLVLRNLAVVRIGPLETQQEENAQRTREQTAVKVPPEKVVEAVQRLLQDQPDDPVTHILASRAARQLTRIARERAAQLPDSLSSLEKAAQLDRTNAAVRFELSEHCKDPIPGNDERAKKERERVLQLRVRALAEAHQLQPRNVTLFLQLITAQADPQVKDPTLERTLEDAEEVLKPLRPLVLREGRLDLEDLRTKAIAAVRSKDWPTAKTLVQSIFNLLNSKLVQRVDRLRVEVGALEYLRHDFSDDFYQRYQRPPAPEFRPSSVSFVVADTQFPPLADIRDLRLVDVDLDGRLDLAVLHESKLTILARPRGESIWKILLETDVPEGMQRLIAADLDRDVARLDVTKLESATEGADEAKKGEAPTTTEFRLLQTCQQAFPDFFLYGPGGVAIVRNENEGTTEKLAPSGGLLRKLTLVQLAPELSKVGSVSAAALVDFDHDQDLDLVLGVEGKGVRLWRMLGNGTFKFEDYTAWSSLPAKDGKISDFAIVDWNRDLYTDILVSYQSANVNGEGALTPLLLANQQHGQYFGQELGKEYESLGNSVAIAPIEVDGNVSWDLVALGEEGINAVLTTTPAPGKVSFLKALPAVRASGRRLATWDYDNDTYTDLLIWGENGATILRGTPSGFQALDSKAVEPLALKGLRAIDFGDLDGDHDLDLVAATADKLMRITNEGGGLNRSLIFFVTGDFNDNQRIGANNSAVGTVVETRTTGRYQSQVITRQPIHVGLGSAADADLVRLIFTNGIPRAASHACVDKLFCEKQVLAGSCPFVYLWDGDRFEFFTDCLWAAPIGLQVAEGKMAPSRAWEYLLIPGNRLKQRNGTYDLQLTEELWEAAYFDQVKLIAVDHPAETDLYTNEKVGGPDIAAPKLHLVRQPRRPVAARDKHGRDVLATVTKHDDVYFRGFDEHITQGLVDEHFLELDLGPLETTPKHITLFLTGWIYPTNTSINVNLSQHPDLEYPRLPYVQVSDGSGGWKEVQAFMGFPGGKTKTIAVELPGEAFSLGEYKLRICTSAEIYWDDVFFTVDEEPIVGDAPEQVKQQPLELVSADLHYRGFSAELPRHPNAPQRFDYAVVETDPKWPPMGGFFTRYGGVQPLLKSADDQMVVMGSGDEMTVRFRVPAEPPPSGWKRDFILYSVGWDKDADLNTVYGQTAEPLPYNAMPSYPYPPNAGYPDTPVLRDYLRNYQTRQQPHWRFWRQLAP